MPTAVVAGGGLAGITAASELADRGYRVTLIEKRPFLGGRSYSYTDQETGATVDNGQHVFLGCCTEYIALLNRLGVRHKAHLQKRLRVSIVDKVWGTSILATADLPPPIHLLPSLLRFKSLSPAEKAAAGWALAHIQTLNRAHHPELDGVTFADWLREKRQSENAIRSLWNLITLPTLNGDINEVSAHIALMVFQEGFLRSRTGANIGWSKVGLSELIGEAACRYIEDRGGEVRLGAGVQSVRIEDGQATGVIADGAEIRADAVVVALDPQSLPEVLPPPLMDDPFFSRTKRLQPSPIVNLHLWYSGSPEWDHPFAAFLNTPIQWVFNKTRLSQQTFAGVQPPPPDAPKSPNGPAVAVTSTRTTHLDISLSGANQWVDLPNAELLTLFTKELWSLIPGLRGATLDRALVVKQRNATFAAHPGVAALRPSQRTPIPGLYLAGDYTDTGWPATMESAVRSGILAATAAASIQALEPEPSRA